MTPPEPAGNGLFALSPVAGDPARWRLRIPEALCAGPRGRPFLFGGCALGGAIAALERSVGRPVVWANAQYHGFVGPGALLAFTTELGGAGPRLSQARLVAEADGRTILTVQATLGAADGGFDGQWIEAPRVPGWRDCPIVHDHRVYETGINTRFEFRLAAGRYPEGGTLDGVRGDGRLILWVRPLGGTLDRPTLAVIADYVSVAICHALGSETGANSLDNTVRFGAGRESEWVLADIAVEAVANGIAHGGARLFSEHGAYLASAATSLVIRKG